MQKSLATTKPENLKRELPQDTLIDKEGRWKDEVDDTKCWDPLEESILESKTKVRLTMM